MNTTNVEIRERIEGNRTIFTTLRRSDVALQLRKVMVSKGIKNADVASRLGVSEANVSRWLRGNQNLRLDTLYSLADALEEPLIITVGSDAACATQELEGSTSLDVSDWSVAEDTMRTRVGNLSANYVRLRAATNESRFSLAQSQVNITVQGQAYEFAAAAA